MIKQRVNELRKLMKKNKLDAYIIPSTDPHQSEYVPALWQRRAWFSGFNGSAGDVIVTEDKAGLWTDSRYFLQAEEQLKDSGIELYKIGNSDFPNMIQFLKDEIKPGGMVGIDPRLLAYSEAQKMETELAAKDISLQLLEENLVDLLWEERPKLPSDAVFIHDKKYAGETAQSKLERIRARMAAEGADMHVLTMLDSIAWTFNIRSTDVDFNPVAISYALITAEKAELFINPKKISKKVKKELKTVVKLYDYNDFKKRLLKQAKRKSKIWLDQTSVSQWIVSLVEKKKSPVIFKESPVTLFKAIKNETELEGFRACHIRDGVAMVKFLHWLEQAVPKGGVSEISASDKLEAFRAELDLFKGLSFETISSYNEHGAIVHYTSSPETDVELKPEGIYLIDSGGQYLDGTTDITRTIALGKPSDEQKDRFTRVLKGHIDLAMASFPEGTQGIQLDTLARKPLWEIGLNYGHGTGHGVGSFLGVHEGPQGISYYRGIGVALEPGMICSNEPGFYKTGEYGMRIETLINVVKDEEKSSTDWQFLKFETATLCPIDRNLIDKNLLSDEELSYLNTYHRRVHDTLAPLLEGVELSWLKKMTTAI